MSCADAGQKQMRPQHKMVILSICVSRLDKKRAG
jgi:hypothetical protein